jgi:chloramphenicol 3-O phosphotransferase
MPGRVVLLNGVSSAGKSALGAALLELLPTPWFRLGVDDVGALRSAVATHRLPAAEVPDVLRRTRAGFHRMVAGLAEAGNDVVADHVLSEPWRLADLLEVLAPYDVVLVGVHCAPEELTRRESLRGDRPVGLAAGQLSSVHAHGVYDVEVDTTANDAAACARVVMGRLDAGPGTAFPRLRGSR